MDGAQHAEVREVSFDEGYPLVEPYLRAHYEELAVPAFRDLMTIKPALERYRQAEREGRFFSLVVLIGDAVVGYSANFLANNLHYSDLLYCQNDVLYLSPEWRKSRLGLTLINRTVTAASMRGAKLMLWHAKYDTALDKLLERLGYTIMDILRAKRI